MPETGNVFHKPYPLLTSARIKWGLVVGGSLFILLFTALFQPFYLRTYTLENKILVISAWSLIGFFSLYFNLFLLPRIFPGLFVPSKWKVIHEIIWITYNVFFVAFACFLFKVFAGFYGFTVERIIYGILATVAVGFFPALIYVLVRQHLISKQHIKALERKRRINLINDKIKINNETSVSAGKPDIKKSREEEIVIPSQRDDKALVIKPVNLYYIESDKNYVRLHVLTGNTIKPFKIRNSISAMDKVFAGYPHILRTHRAFIVNLHYAGKIEREGNHYAIHLKNREKIPVSKTYLKPVMQYFRV